MGLQVWDDIHATKLSNDRIEESTRGATHYCLTNSEDEGVVVHWKSKTETHLLDSHDMTSVMEFIYDDTFSHDHGVHKIILAQNKREIVSRCNATQAIRERVCGLTGLMCSLLQATVME